jgi:hypothetical protein
MGDFKPRWPFWTASVSALQSISRLTRVGRGQRGGELSNLARRAPQKASGTCLSTAHRRPSRWQIPRCRRPEGWSASQRQARKMGVIKTLSGAHALVDVGCRERRKAELSYTSLSHGVGNRSDVRFRRPLKCAVLSSWLHLDRLGKDGPAQGIFQPEPRALRGPSIGSTSVEG